MRWSIALVLSACGFSHVVADDAGGPDAPPADRMALGTRLVDHAAVVGGITSDGYVIFSDNDDAGHSIAKAIPIAGGSAVAFATSAGTGKQDIRFEIWDATVFAWTDRGNRVSTLTMWSAATGPVPYGDNIRPGRAAATSDGRAIFERDITDTTASIVAGPIGGPAVAIDTANSADSACWQDTDFARVGTRLLVRYCPAGATAFTLRSVGPDGFVDLSTDAVEAAYSDTAAIWRESSGALVATRDGLVPHPLASDVTDFATTHDLSHVATLAADGSMIAIATDGSSLAHFLGTGAQQLGALSPDGQTVLYASKLDDQGGTTVQPYADVIATTPAGPLAIAPGTTSCPACLYDSFSADGAYALVLDPIDNSQIADGEGPLRIVTIPYGRDIQRFGTNMYTAIATGGDRFAYVDAIRDPMLLDGWAYGLYTGAATAMPAQVARGAEEFAIDRARTALVVSFEGTDDVAGLWVTPL